MTYNLQLTERVRRRLASLDSVEEKKMFGSVGFMVNGKLCLGVGDHDDHQLMVRVGPEAYAEALGKPGAAPMVMRGREYKGYVFVTAEGVESEEDLDYWIAAALAFNERSSAAGG